MIRKHTVQFFSLFLLLSTALVAQNQKILSTFLPTQGTFNGRVEDHPVQIVFYLIGNTFSMSELVSSEDNQVYGELVPIYTEIVKETVEKGKIEKFYFNWKFTHSIRGKDDEQGSAIIVISRIHTPIGLGFGVKIMDGNNLSIMDYSGLMKGTATLSEYLKRFL